MATEYGNRLRTARKLRGLTQVELSKATGIAQSTISTAEQKGSKSLETTTYAKVLRVRPEWLATGEGSMELQEDRKTIREPSSMLSAVTEIPLLNKDTAGMFKDYLDGTIKAENVHNYHNSKTDGLFAFSVEDDLMEPNIPKGCQAIISTKLRPKHGASVLIHDGKTAFIRRLVIDGSNTLMQSAYSSQPLQGSIIGVVQQITIWFHDLGEDE